MQYHEQLDPISISNNVIVVFLLDIILWRTHYYYFSPNNPEHLSNRLLKFTYEPSYTIFPRKYLHTYPKYTTRFIENNTFTTKHKTYLFERSANRNDVHMTGTVQPHIKNSTVLHFTIRPRALYLCFGTLSLFLSVQFLFYQEWRQSGICSLIFCFFYLGILANKWFLRKNFVAWLDLKPFNKKNI